MVVEDAEARFATHMNVPETMAEKNQADDLTDQHVLLHVYACVIINRRV